MSPHWVPEPLAKHAPQGLQNLPNPLLYPPSRPWNQGFGLQFVAEFFFFFSFPFLSEGCPGILFHTEVGKNSAAASGNLVSPAT